MTGNQRSDSSTHLYTYAGTFMPRVSIYNYFLDCSNQTNYPPTPMMVDALIPSFKLTGDPICLLLHPDHNTTTHFGERNFQICIPNLAAAPIYAKMSINWGDGTNEVFNFTCNSTMIGSSVNFCSSGYTFCAFTPYHKYYIWGQIYTNGIIWNALNSKPAYFSHHMYSQVTEIRENLYAISESTNFTLEGGSGYNSAWDEWYSSYYPLENRIWFISNMTYGTETNLTYWWNFGDGIQYISARPYAVHQYANPGAYVVTLNVSNPLSSEKTTNVINTWNETLVVSTTIFVQRYA